MAGPCTIESEAQCEEVAAGVAEAGARVMRGGAFKPRTSPYSFQGHGEKGLRIIRKAADRHGLLVISEVMESAQIPLAHDYIDIIQIGTRNMQNYNLLRDIGKSGIPALLKRGMSATITDLLLASEYIMAEGNHNVLLCERGIRTFENLTRNTLDLSAVPVVKQISHLPIIVDPSHAVGIRNRVAPLSQAAVAVGADGPPHRGAPGSGERSLRRRPVAVRLPVRRAHGQHAADRSGRRQEYRRTGVGIAARWGAGNVRAGNGQISTR